MHNPLERMVLTQGFGDGETAPALLEKYKTMGLVAHNGHDYFAYDGWPVYAAHDGVVTFSGHDGGGGLGVVITTHEPFEYDGGKAFMKTISWHLKEGSICVLAGQNVTRGQKIAEADNTGMSTGSHLHFGLKPVMNKGAGYEWETVDMNNGFKGAIDPTPYFVKFQKPMKFGEQSQNVRDMQDFLKEKGFFTAQGTGYYGEITRKAVLNFQLKYCDLSWYEKNVLRGNRVGEKTLKALNDLAELSTGK